VTVHDLPPFMTREPLPNVNDGFVSEKDPSFSDKPIAPVPAELLFIVDEYVKRGLISYWVDPYGAWHFGAPGHPGLALTPPNQPDTTMGFHV